MTRLPTPLRCEPPGMAAVDSTGPIHWVLDIALGGGLSLNHHFFYMSLESNGALKMLFGGMFLETK